MHRFAWKNRLSLGLGVVIASVALIAGCAEDENGAEDDLGLDDDPVATETVEGTDATPAATEDMTETPEGSDDPAAAEDVTLNITADGVMMDGTMAQTVTTTTGSTVTIQNDTENAVNVTTDDGTIDEEIEAGDSYEHTFDEAGTWSLMVDGEEMTTITVE